MAGKRLYVFDLHIPGSPDVIITGAEDPPRSVTAAKEHARALVRMNRAGTRCEVRPLGDPEFTIKDRRRA